ncbi:MAG: hypothetical protein NW241_15520 [Bacteroidia bacterium]|nr:hypothetical protein [Bacteroidia bacterium]
MNISIETITSGFDLVEKLVIVLGKTRQQLLGDPEAARQKLGEVISTLEDHFNGIYEPVATFLALPLDDPACLAENEKKLMAWEGGAIGSLTVKADFSCRQIAQIYQEHLDRWFNRVLRKENQELKDMKDIFNQLSGSDVHFYHLIGQLSYLLQEESSTIRKLLESNQASARAYQLELRRKWMPKLQNCSSLLSDLNRLKLEYYNR